ncbi:putative efflux protein, MATE family [Halovenus aranensis]|uniref:Multidrug-efflux transporter n=2 Tax=Halovenus aranensis TaxID=890420 RepID=A0A1G8WMC1_9EURY|nr:MATE family efflux transporter [Halovenus aranensis]SDJ78720.1 putative efflux protein, MATE family [Halovenus aranensis]
MATERKGIDMTTGAIAPKVLALSWPLVLGNLLQTAYNLADIFWVGRVGSDAVAGVSLMFPLSWMFVSTAVGLTAATIALVSQYVGADDRRKADHVVAQTVLLALGVSAVLATLGFLFREELLALMGAEDAVFDAALAYIEVIFLTLPLTFLFFAFRAALQGAGDTRTAMWLVFISAGMNVIIDPFFILGWGPLPEMGTRGAGWATFVARAFAAGTGIVILLRGGFGVKLYLRDLAPDPTLLKKLVDVGYPATLDGWARSFASVAMAAFVTPFGTAAIAAYGIGIRLMSVTWSVAGAVGQAAATGVGQNLGADTPDRARRVTWVATAGTMAMLFVAGGICILVPEFLIGLFDDSADTVAEGRTFLTVIAPFWGFFGGTMVIQGAFRGAGQTKVAMALSVLARWVFRIPIALALAFSFTITVPVLDLQIAALDLGVIGVWASFAIGAFVTFLLAAFWFSLGRWAEGVIDDDAVDETGAASTEQSESSSGLQADSETEVNTDD